MNCPYSLEGLDAAAEANAHHSTGLAAANHTDLVNSESESVNSNIKDNESSQFANPFKPVTPLQATIQLLEVASRIDNAVSELQRCSDVLPGQLPTPNAIMGTEESEVISLIRQYLAPFLILASQCIIESATILAPIQGSKVLHSRKDSDWKRRVLAASECRHDNRTPSLQLIHAWVTSCHHNTEEFWRKKIESKAQNPKCQPRQQPQPSEPPQAHRTGVSPQDSICGEVTSLQQEPIELTSDVKSIVLPVPQNGTQYSKIEALSIITRCTNNQRGLAIKEMLDKKYVPLGRAKMYELLKTYNENITNGQLNGGIWNEDWGKKGRPKKGQEQNPVSAKKSEAKYPRIISTKGQQFNILLQSTGRMKTLPSMPPIALPFPPQNGKYYLKSEFLQIVSRYPKSKRNVAGGHCRGQIIKYIVQNKLVNTCKSTLYRVLEMWENDPNFVIDCDEWKACGRTNVFSDDEIDKLVLYIHSHQRTYNHTDINNLLVDIARRRALAKGQDPARIPDKLSKSTVRNYITIIASKLELLDGDSSNEKRKKGFFRYADGKLILGRSEDDRVLT